MIDGVMIDVGGVFMLPAHEPVLAALDRVGVPPNPSAIDRACYAGISAFDQTGKDDTYRLAYAKALGVPDERLPAAVTEIFLIPNPWTRVHWDSVDGLRALVEAGVPVAIISNSDGTVEERLRTLGICQVGPGSGVCVRAVIDSGSVGIAKPDPRIFELGLQASGLSPDRTVYVGDSVRIDVEGARAAGIRPLHFDPFGLCPSEDHEDISSLREVVPLVTR